MKSNKISNLNSESAATARPAFDFANAIDLYMEQNDISNETLAHRLKLSIKEARNLIDSSEETTLRQAAIVANSLGLKMNISLTHEE